MLANPRPTGMEKSLFNSHYTKMWGGATPFPGLDNLPLICTF